MSAESDSPTMSTTLRCDIPGCSFFGSGVKSVHMHKLRCHRKEATKCLHLCNFPGCHFSHSTAQGVAAHKQTSHNNTENMTVDDDESVVSLDSVNVGREAVDITSRQTDFFAG